MTIKCWYSADGGATWEGPYETGQPAYTSDDVFATGNLSSPEPTLGMYEAIVATNPPPDEYYSRDPVPQIALTGAPLQPTTKAQETHTYTSLTLEQIRDRKFSDGEQYADNIAFNNAQAVAPNDHLYIETSRIDLNYYWAVDAFYSKRHKDRTLGLDSSAGYQPGTDPDPTTYWTRDPEVVFVNSNNGNRNAVTATESDWGNVIRAVGIHLFDVRTASAAYRTDVETAYDASDRAALVALDPATYPWPPTYTG